MLQCRLSGKNNFVYVIPDKEGFSGLRCSRSYKKTYFDQYDEPFNTKAGAGWVNIEEGYRGWQAHGRQMGDSSCDSIFNVETCLYDMGDCCLPGRYTIKRLKLHVWIFYNFQIQKIIVFIETMCRNTVN